MSPVPKVGLLIGIGAKTKLPRFGSFVVASGSVTLVGLEDGEGLSAETPLSSFCGVWANPRCIVPNLSTQSIRQHTIAELVIVLCRRRPAGAVMTHLAS